MWVWKIPIFIDSIISPYKEAGFVSEGVMLCAHATSTIKSTDELPDEVILYNGKFWQDF